MKAPEMFAIAAVAFAFGAWLSQRGEPHSSASPLPRRPAAAPSPAPAVLRAGHEVLADEHWTRLASALHDRLPLRRRALLADALADFTIAEMAGAIARAEKLPPDDRQATLHALVARWFALAPDSAARWCRSRMTPELLCIWARFEPEVVLREMETFPSAKFAWRDHGLDRIIAPSPCEQASVLEALPPGPTRDELLALTLACWAGDDSPAAWAFAGSLPAGALRERVEAETLLMWAKRDPEQAAALAQPLLPSLPASLGGNRFIIELTARLAEHDLAAAQRWVEELPPDFHPAAALATARAWAGSDPAAALDWTRAQGLEVARNSRVEGRWTGTVLGNAMHQHPAETAAWLLALPPGEDRDGLIERAAFHRMDLLPPDQTNTGAEPWMRALYRAMRPESRERVARFMGEKATALRGP